MKAEVREAMSAAEMDARMVVGTAIATVELDYTAPTTRAAFAAIQRADRSGHPTDQGRAERACEAWIDANEAAALTIIAARKAKRDAYKAELARPKTAAEIEAMYTN
jgi:hypothetical protein